MLDDDVLTFIVEGSIVVSIIVSCELSTDSSTCVGSCCVEAVCLLPTVEGSGVLLNVVLMVEVGILLIVPALVGGYYYTCTLALKYT